MKKQVIVIHGGDAFDTYEEYLKNLQDKLGNDYQVIAPRMPNASNAKYLEWQIWFEKVIPFINDNVVLVGHSLGGMFLAKYLAENKFPKKIKATLLIASPHTDELKEPIADFIIPKDLSLLGEQGGKIFLYYSSDDTVVANALKHLEIFQKNLPRAKAVIFTDRGHFSSPEFPEIVSQIKNLQ